MDSFQDESEGPTTSEHKEAIGQLVDHLGEVALPILMRNLVGSSRSSHWAGTLLLRLAQDDRLRPRICRELKEYKNAPALSPSYQLFVSDVLASIEGHHSELPEAQNELSTEFSGIHLASLANRLRTFADVAQVADSIVSELSAPEIEDLVEDLSLRQPGAAKLLVQELVLRDDLDQRFRHRLQDVTTSLTGVFNELPLSIPKRPRLRLAKDAEGNTSLLCYLPIVDSSPTLFRAVQLKFHNSDGFVDADYSDAIGRDSIDREFIHPLVKAGYEIGPICLEEAQKRIQIGMRIRSNRGLPMPRAYFLGRDLLGLHDEHMVRRPSYRCEIASLLARGTELMSRGDTTRAHRLLLRYLEFRPTDAEAMSALGNCLIEMGRLKEARSYLEHAVSISPKVGRYHWNRASLAHREGRFGECIASFQTYLGCHDADEGQRVLARAFVQKYRRQITLTEQTPHLFQQSSETEKLGTSGFTETE